MSIKQSIYAFFLLLGVSFNSSASQLYEVTSMYTNDIPDSGIKVGMVATASAFSAMVMGKKYYSNAVNYKGKVFQTEVFSNGQRVYFCSGNYCSASFPYWKAVSACPTGTHLSVSGVCEEPKCENGEVFNPETGLCEMPPDFCDSDSTLEDIFAAEQECAAQNGIFSYECFNGNGLLPPSLDTRCTQPTHCVIGMPHWPECLGDIDPTNPVEPPGSGFNPGTGESVNPTPPSFDKDNPDTVTPQDNTDKAVLEAIQNMNRDANKASTAINKDMNQGFADLNTALNNINNVNTEIGNTIVDQMKQDHEYFMANKELQLNQTAAIMAGTDQISGAISSQTDTLSGGLADISGSIGDLASKLEGLQGCDPNTDPLSCEGKSGMTTDLVGDINTQVNDAVSGAFDSAQTEIIDAAQGFVDDAGVSTIQVHIDDMTTTLLDVFPRITDCTAFSLPSPFGGSIHFDCEFSVKFKTLASWLFYIYTLWTLIDILLNDITPVAPATTRKYFH